ncbi:hypothetical protein [Streptomyces sp. NPDC052107]|uniref:hypothetical protein n=1 Tax=Streptomyces sp. NPDC052107 TaxID=3155632 RepID=UPI0034286DE2
MSRRPAHPARSVTAAAAALAAVGALTAAAAPGSAHPHPAARHVLLLSVDGLHQTDLAWYIVRHPHSALAGLAAGGVQYTHAATTNRS